MARWLRCERTRATAEPLACRSSSPNSLVPVRNRGTQRPLTHYTAVYSPRKTQVLAPLKAISVSAEGRATRALLRTLERNRSDDGGNE